MKHVLGIIFVSLVLTACGGANSGIAAERDALQEQVTGYQTEIEDLKSTVTNLEGTITSLEGELEVTEGELQSTLGQLTEVEEMANAVSDERDTLQSLYTNNINAQLALLDNELAITSSLVEELERRRETLLTKAALTSENGMETDDTVSDESTETDTEEIQDDETEPSETTEDESENNNSEENSP